MKILVVCQMGFGTSFMVEMVIKDILKEINVDAEVTHCDVMSAKSEVADIFIGASDVISLLENDDAISLNNILDKSEIKEKLEKKLGGM